MIPTIKRKGSQGQRTRERERPVPHYEIYCSLLVASEQLPSLGWFVSLWVGPDREGIVERIRTAWHVRYHR